MNLFFLEEVMKIRKNISGLDVHIEIKKIKNMYIRVLPPKGIVKVTAPTSFTQETIDEFINLNKVKIHATIKRIQETYRQEDLQYTNSEAHELWGQSYKLNLIESSKNTYEIKDGVIELHLKDISDFDTKKKLVDKLYRDQLKECLNKIIPKYASKMNLVINEFRIKKMKTRWGTCNIKDKRIWINLELAKTPLQCLEYVVVHELSHLMEPSHNKRFYNIQERYFPDWKRARQLLVEKPIDWH